MPVYKPMSVQAITAIRINPLIQYQTLYVTSHNAIDIREMSRNMSTNTPCSGELAAASSTQQAKRTAAPLEVTGAVNHQRTPMDHTALS